MLSDQNGVFTLSEPVHIGWQIDHKWGTHTSAEIIVVNVAGCESQPIAGESYSDLLYDRIEPDQAFEDLRVQVMCEQQPGTE